MNIKEFVKLIGRYKWLIVIIPLITLTVTFFFVKNLPKEYKSQAKISTGLLDPSKQIASDGQNNNGSDFFKVTQQFTNIIDIMTMPKNISILSYRLILHDLKNPQNPFKKPSDDVKALSDADRQEAIRLFEERLAKQQVITPLDNYKIKLYNLIKSMGYDEKSINKKLSITHNEYSDFITVEFTSENTLLSVFVVNTLSNDFINNYGIDLTANKNQSILLLDSLLKNKETVMNEKNQQLKNYKIQNRVLNLDKQSQIIYQQIIDYEDKKSQALREIQSYQNALVNIKNKLNSKNSENYLGSDLVVDNQKIIGLKNKLQAANDKYIDGGFQPRDKRTADSLQSLLNSQLTKTSDSYINDPLIAKQNLVQQRIDLEVSLDKAKGSVNTINQELNQLNAKFSTMVPYDAGVQNYERDADVATKEYLEILNRYNQTTLDKNIGLRLQLQQEGVPTQAEPSKKILYMALAAVASFIICFVILLIIYLLDNSINSIQQLQTATKNKVIGELNLIGNGNKNIDEIWKNAETDKDFARYKNLLRTLRFEINKSLVANNSKILAITSLHQTGNAFTASSIAYTFASLGKQVLVIGNDLLADEMKKVNVSTTQSFKDLLKNGSIQKDPHITFINNELDGLSLLENRDRDSLTDIFSKLKNDFDLIIINLDGLDTISDTKEWILFADKYLATFKAGDTIKDSDRENIHALKLDEKFIGWLLYEVKHK